GLDELPMPHIRCMVSNGARGMVRVGFGLEPADHGYQQKHTEFLDLYEQGMTIDTCLFAGMDDLLRNLEQRAIPWGIVTNKPVRFAAPVIAALGLAERCATLICPDHVSQRKPHPEPMFLACKEVNAEPRTAIYVGDHQRDIDAGINAGMTTIAVRYGYIEKPEDVDLWGSHYTVDSVSELAKLLQ
ncbi:MAG TPA: HAD-IA family hydrolase, partial [Marinobacter sp.]|nr:HAD-IA family hydrolase [Marinobacter sp.]